MSKFNDSLLAKQIRRWKNNEHTLFHKVFKAKFFPNCSIMDCDSAGKGSYVWKSIIQARHVIELGIVWRVGNGQSIYIKEDRWLPQLAGSRIVSPPAILPPNSKVCDLVDHESLSWNKDLIEQEFLPHKAKFIQALPLSVREIPDKEVWLSSPYGEYTTRTAYKLMEKAQRNNLPSRSSNVANNKLWKGLWSLQVPYKVKHFL